MRHEKFRQSGKSLFANEIGYGAENDDLYETDLERSSAEEYEQRQRIWKRFNRGDWWIAVAVYLLLCSFAFVIL